MTSRWRTVRSLGLFFVAVWFADAARAEPFAYVADRDEPSVSVIDLATNTVATINIPDINNREPYWVAISRNGATVAVSLHQEEVAIIDGRTNTLKGFVDTGSGENEAVAVSSDGRTVFVADEFGDLYIVDVGTMMVVDSIDIDGDTNNPCDGAENMVITPDDRTLFVTCEDGNTVLRVDIAAGTFQTIADDGEHGIALNCEGSLLYYGDGEAVLEYDVAGGALTGRTLVGCDLYGGAVSPDGKRFYCVEESDNLRVYDLDNLMEVTNLTLSDNDATAVGVSPNSKVVYVPTSQDDHVNVVDAIGLGVPPTIDVGDAPRGIAIANCLPPRSAPVSGYSGIVALIGLLFLFGIGRLRSRRRPAA